MFVKNKRATLQKQTNKGLHKPRFNQRIRGKEKDTWRGKAKKGDSQAKDR